MNTCSKEGSTLVGIFGVALSSILLLCGAGLTPTGNVQKSDVNANGFSLTNAASVQATNIYAANVYATNGISGPMPATSLTGVTALANGGTGGTSAATARTGLGLGSAATNAASAFVPANVVYMNVPVELSNTKLAEYTFQDPVIAAGSNIGSSGHPLQVTGDVSATPAGDLYGQSTTAYLAGTPSSVTVTADNEQLNPIASGLETTTILYLTTGASTSVVNLVATDNSSNSSNAMVNFTTAQTGSLGINVTGLAQTSANSTEIDFHGASLSSFTLSSASMTSNGGNYSTLTFYLDSATAVNIAQNWYSGLNSCQLNFYLECNATTLTLPSAFSGPGCATIAEFDGPFNQATVDAILALYNNAYPAGASNGGLYLTIGGSSATPSSAGLAAKATIIANGGSVSTN